MNNVIIIMYDGHAPSKEEIESIVTTLAAHGTLEVIGDTTPIVKHFDSDSIAKAILRESVKSIVEEPLCKISTNEPPVVHACTLIMELFGEYIKKGNKNKTDTGCYVGLMFALSSAVKGAVHRMAQNAHTTKDVALINAVKLISQDPDAVTPAIRKQTGMTLIATEIIRHVAEIEDL